MANADEKIQTFDSFATNDTIRKWKLLLPHLPTAYQNRFALVIKLMEVSFLESGLRSGSTRPPFPEATPLQADFANPDPETIAFLEELLPYSSPEEKKRINRIKDTMASISRMHETMEMFQMLRELFPEAFSGDQDPMEMFSRMQEMHLF